MKSFKDYTIEDILALEHPPVQKLTETKPANFDGETKYSYTDADGHRFYLKECYKHPTLSQFLFGIRVSDNKVVCFNMNQFKEVK